MSRAWITIYRNFQNFQVCLCLENSLCKAWIPKTEHAIAELCLMPKHACDLQTQNLLTRSVEMKTPLSCGAGGGTAESVCPSTRG